MEDQRRPEQLTSRTRVGRPKRVVAEPKQRISCGRNAGVRDRFVFLGVHNETNSDLHEQAPTPRQHTQICSPLLFTLSLLNRDPAQDIRCRNP